MTMKRFVLLPLAPLVLVITLGACSVQESGLGSPQDIASGAAPSPSPSDADVSSATDLADFLHGFETPVVFEGRVDQAAATVTVTSVIVAEGRTELMVPGAVFALDPSSGLQGLLLAQREATVLGAVVGSTRELVVTALIDEAGTLTPDLWQDDYDRLSAFLGLDTRDATLAALVQRSVEDPTFANPPPVDPYDAWFARPVEQRFIDAGDTPARILEELTTATTVAFDLPDALRTPPGGVIDESELIALRLSAPDLAASFGAVALSAGDPFTTLFVPDEGALRATFVRSDGQSSRPIVIDDLREVAAAATGDAVATLVVTVDDPSDFGLDDLRLSIKAAPIPERPAEIRAPLDPTEAVVTP